MAGVAEPHPLDLGQALAFVVDDPQARAKLLLGALLLALPIVNVTVVGYQVAVARAVASGQARALPGWDDLGEYFSLGLGLALARLVYALPGLLLWAVPLAGALALALRSVAAGEVPAELESALWPYLALGLCLVALGALYGLLAALLGPAVVAQYVRLGNISACFNLRAILALIRRHRAFYLRLWLTQWAEGLFTGFILVALSLVLGLVPCAGGLARGLVVFALAFVSMVIDGYLVGQLVRLEPA